MITYEYLPIHPNNTIKFTDDTTVLELISGWGLLVGLQDCSSPNRKDLLMNMCGEGGCNLSFWTHELQWISSGLAISLRYLSRRGRIY